MLCCPGVLPVVNLEPNFNSKHSIICAPVQKHNLRKPQNMLVRLYTALSLSLHLIAYIYEIVIWLIFRLQAATQWSYDFCRSRKAIADRDRKFLERCKSQLNKLPRHISVIVGPDNKQFDAEIFTRIVTYALLMGIDCISLYDTRCVSTGNIALETLQAPKGVQSKKLEDHHFVWSMPTVGSIKNGKKKVETNGAVNGFANGQLNHKSEYTSVEIYEISRQNGGALIADVCIKLFKERHNADIQELLKDRTRLTQRIDDELSQRLGKFLDPDLAIIFNCDTCTFGMLPWQTRFTEFQTHETGRYFNSETFAKVLYRYSRCEQRWGK